jgi:putative copper resistance protein D
MLPILATARFIHFAAATLLFGLAAFPFYARVTGEAGQAPVRVQRALALAALITAVILLAVSAANMTGYWSTLFDIETLGDVVQGTGFGQVQGVRILLGVGLVAIAWRRRPAPDRGRDPALALGAAIFLFSIADTGHSRMDSGVMNWAHIFADALHLVAAGAWLGGLLALVLLVRRLTRLGRETAAATVLHDFSGMGSFAVAVLIATGLFKSWRLVGSLHGLIATAFGWTLMVKLVLFGGMVALALANRLWISPAMDAQPGDAAMWLRRLKRQVTLELALGLLVLAAVGLLGALQPPVSL